VRCDEPDEADEPGSSNRRRGQCNRGEEREAPQSDHIDPE